MKICINFLYCVDFEVLFQNLFVAFFFEKKLANSFHFFARKLATFRKLWYRYILSYLGSEEDIGKEYFNMWYTKFTHEYWKRGGVGGGGVEYHYNIKEVKSQRNCVMFLDFVISVIKQAKKTLKTFF